MPDIRDYEAMAKLELTDEERKWVSSRLDKIFESFEEMDDVNVADVAPLVSVLTPGNVLRDDVAERPVAREELLGRAPAQYDGYFEAPKTLE